MQRIADVSPWLIPELREIIRRLPPVEFGRAVIQRERVKLADMLREHAQPHGFADRFIPGLERDPLVRLRLYRPSRPSPLPALIWLHGGGWTLGVPEVDELMLRGFADGAGLQIVSVDYRLAPEHPFPAALRDGEAALRWTHASAPELGVDPSALAVGGSSAGASIAAGLCLRLRDAGGPAPAFQLLMFPALDDRLESASMRSIGDPRTINREFMCAAWRAYLGTHEPSPYASPARASDLHGLPPAALIAAEFDPLRDEAIRYAERMWSAAIRCELHVFRGALHGFDAPAPRSALAQSATRIALSRLARAHIEPTMKRLRPACFAIVSPLSAAPSSASSRPRQPGPLVTAMPRLAVTPNSALLPAGNLRSASCARARSATTIAPCRLVFGKISANFSPPMRAGTSLVRTACCTTSAIAQSTASAAALP
jgi:acetyl esterase/lipase